ncbi:VCBS repeat-containing protein [Fibrella aquatilis]|uniref:VCBS repeat-containing protein n=1 Tax=Fibrella aquatilis TaxID=2817059 RepID=A0A939GCI1_9BACT|nr:VCBS repeat-containing protein [Fibrella aquatilis]MBO0933873.1 VCBS repeat-containing protein [Fibrella aquatilis]
MKTYLFMSLGAALIGLTGWLASRGHSDTLFARVPSAQTGITFANVLTETDSLNALTFEYMYNGAGVGVGDFNRDGLADLYFAGNQVTSRLYLNQTKPGGVLRFSDITAPSKTSTDSWCTGVSVADVNQDGWPDIYVCVAGKTPKTPHRANKLFINNGLKTGGGIPTFTEQAEAYGLNDTGYSTQAVFFDYDRDGDLDCYLLTNALEPSSHATVRPKRLNGEAPDTDRLYENRGGHFINVSRAAGILAEGYGLGVCLSDLDSNGWPDLYCANDFISNDLVWMNNGNHADNQTVIPIFHNQAGAMLKHQTHNAMGVDIADINNDALPDIVVLDMLPANNYRQKMMLPGSNFNRFQLEKELDYQPQFMRNTLQLNRGTAAGGVATFSEIGQLAGIEKTDWSWAPLLADFDNDGWKDLYITNGYRRDVTNLDFIVFNREQASFGTLEAQTRQALNELRRLPDVAIPKYAYRNRGADPATALTFEDVSVVWGLDQTGFANGAAYADLDNDGDLDLITNNIDAEAMVLENRLNQRTPTATQPAPHWLRLTINPAQGLPITIGTKVWLYAQGQQQMLELAPVRGFVSTVENRLHFGMGSCARYDSLVIRYPNGKKQVLGPGKANRMLTVPYNPAGDWSAPLPTTTPLFTQLSDAESGLSLTHQETPVVDFNRTPLLPHQFSRNGPYLAVGDVNGDQLDDFFMGADFGHPANVYVQQLTDKQRTNGKFSQKILPGSESYEAMGAVFFDADGDGDQDLYVVSGGSRVEGLSDTYQDRLYLNDGRGNFQPALQALPNIQSSGATVTVADMDGDGDLDLFRGGRVVPGQYPKPAPSYLLRNDSKSGRATFADVTDGLAPGLRHIGMVTAALWTDADNDHHPDLMLVGEWMAPTLFRNTKGRLNRRTVNGLSNETGWWCSLLGADMDGDGDQDYVAGNLGLNSKFRASATEPVRVFADDFDQNGRLDPILTHYLQHQHVPVPQRDVLMAQIPAIKKRFPTYHDYASHLFEDLFSDEERTHAYQRDARQLASCYIENQGHFRFVVRPLPIEAQMAPINGLAAHDFTGDGILDLLVAGNFYGTETIGGQQDAGKGLLLAGTKKGVTQRAFRPVMHSGLNMDGDVKSLAPLRRPNGTTWWLTASNDGPLHVWQSITKSTPL